MEDDKETLLAKIKKREITLKFVNKELRDDKEMVMVAVNQNGHSLEYASDRLKNDINFCIQCAKIKEESIPYFSNDVKSVFQKFDNNVNLVEHYFQQFSLQQQADAALLAKIKGHHLPITPTQLFRRKPL